MNTDDTRQLLYDGLTRLIMGELEREPDEVVALRKALLLLILLVQDDASPCGKELTEYLLLGFQPLAAHFKEQAHPFYKDEIVGRARDQNDQVLLVVSKTLVESILPDRDGNHH
ncbi:hypothetical protein A2264_01105 [candidate division WWE3 bacterium RIFOXYA2_FULL_46_9]|uniref:Uncharacterized protein n=1 Tax=candidate division WWE3 bacterium RIFOXYA2_FULL_46_9 TaxID=1802636 RepID=A0A1F4VZJ6_UNCKA|nr:MAG: hypothetical protein A2264_01105 [candidate division WWE3 bacterium RIFOXYA2_FULL_46_9]